METFPRGKLRSRHLSSDADSITRLDIGSTDVHDVHDSSENSRASIDISVDFLSWVNSEMRKLAREPEEYQDETAKNVGLVNRLRAYVAARIAPQN